MFPLSLKGEVSVQTEGSVSVDAVEREIAESLRAAGLHDIVAGSGAVRFRNDAVFMWSFRIYVTANRGVFLVRPAPDKAGVAYEIFVVRLFVISIIIATFIALILSPAKNLNLLEKLGIATGFWLWLFGLNYLLIWARTRAMLRRLLRKFAV